MQLFLFFSFLPEINFWINCYSECYHYMLTLATFLDSEISWQQTQVSDRSVSYWRVSDVTRRPKKLCWSRTGRIQWYINFSLYHRIIIETTYIIILYNTQLLYYLLLYIQRLYNTTSNHIYTNTYRSSLMNWNGLSNLIIWLGK